MGNTPYIVTCKYCNEELRVADYNQKWHKKCKPKPKSFKYPRIFYDRRHDVIARDSSRCQECGEQRNDIHVHHIDQNIKNNESTNLICLCPTCHKQAHSGNKTYKVKKAKKLEVGECVSYKPTHLFINT